MQKSVIHMQSYCLTNQIYSFFDVLDGCLSSLVSMEQDKRNCIPAFSLTGAKSW